MIKRIINALVRATTEQAVAIDQLMPGVKHIAVQNYKNLNEAPLNAVNAAASAESFMLTPEAAFLDEVMDELAFARNKFPGNELTMLALAEEFGEVAKALLDEPWADLRKECVQLASMAIRLAIEGDASAIGKRQRKGLDQRPTIDVTHFAMHPIMEDGLRFRFLVNELLKDESPIIDALQAAHEPKTIDEFRRQLDGVRHA